MSADEGEHRTQGLLWKIFLTVGASSATFAMTTFVKDSDAWPVMLSVFVGGVTLVVHFLLDVEARQLSVDVSLRAFEQRQEEAAQQVQASVMSQLERFNQVNILLARLDSGPLEPQPVIDLLQHAAALDRAAPALVYRLAEAQIADLSTFLNDLVRGREVTASGDEWTWTFTLTSNVRESIDATSLSALGVDGQTLWDEDGWHSELGQRYVELQAQAIRRGVMVRRIFILESSQLAGHSGLRQICDQQAELGIDIRLIDAKTAAAIAPRYIPLIIFDRAISYELTPSRFPTGSPGFLKTTMVLNPFQVNQRLEMFDRLWAGAKKYESF